MKVRTLMRRDVIRTDVTTSLHEAAAKMRIDNVSALPVVNGEELVGIITERDVVGALVDGMDARCTAVSVCMTPQPISVSPEEAVSEAAFRMVTAAARHLPVVEHGRLVGILSARDLLVLHLSEWSSPGVAAQ
jgi:CBS domain-containing protein